MKQESGNLTLESPEAVANVETRAVGSSDWLGSVSVTNEDCMALMARYPDKHFDLAIVDPPYGAGDAFNFRFAKLYTNHAPSNEYFTELFRVSRHQIIWGGNYFPLPCSKCWTIWEKENPAPNFSDFEMAWMSFDKISKRIRIPSWGAMHADGKTIHPTQKPIKLYTWLLEHYATPGQRILDTHLGSGSHAIACHYFGAHLTACELDPDYFKAAQERIARETAQTTLF